MSHDPHVTDRAVHQRHLMRREIDTAESLQRHLDEGADLRGYVFHGVDLSAITGPWGPEHSLRDTLLLGCTFRDDDQRHAIERLGAYAFPELRHLPYHPYRTALYTVDELMQGYEQGGYTATLDFRIFAHFDRARRLGAGVSIRETLAQRLHDHAIDEALTCLLEQRDAQRVVGVMGGHSAQRTDASYRKVAHLCWEITRRGMFVASGGGPGIMEAANLGAYLARFANPKVVDEAIAMMAHAPRFDGHEQEGTPAYLHAIDRFVAASRAVVERFGAPCVAPHDARLFAPDHARPGSSLAVPTWFYGHEPSNLFSTYVAKYFANSIREDGLLALSLGGVVYAPGSAGTLQEVFMDLAQNHYATFRYRSPMVFLGTDHFAPIVALIRDFIASRGMDDLYGDMIALFDDPQDVANYLDAHPPRAPAQARPLYELIDGAS